MKITKRQLAARFVEAIDVAPASVLAAATIEVAVGAGYDQDDLIGLIVAVEQELQARFGVANIQLTTAHDLPQAIFESLAAAVAKLADIKGYSYTQVVDPELLGGFEAQAGDLVVRDSIRGRLARLEVGRG